MVLESRVLVNALPNEIITRLCAKKEKNLSPTNCKVRAVSMCWACLNKIFLTQALHASLGRIHVVWSRSSIARDKLNWSRHYCWNLRGLAWEVGYATVHQKVTHIWSAVAVDKFPGQNSGSSWLGLYSLRETGIWIRKEASKEEAMWFSCQFQQGLIRKDKKLPKSNGFLLV